jgi:CsoR family transcriptional regulator, copper-sensing transcriptional repressor
MTTTHTHGYYENKEQVLKRLKRAEGQVRGIARMVEEDKYCIDVLTQVNAAQAALDKVAIELMRDHARHCMTHITDEAEQKVKAEELANAIGRMLSR